MSRNLCTTSCVECKARGPIVLEEAPRHPRPDEVHIYYGEYKNYTFAKAHCGTCLAQYLAWVDCPGRSMGHLSRSADDERPFVDLSYRSSFNDEYGKREDRRQYEVVEFIKHTRVRRIHWCRHGNRELHEPVETCHDCRRAKELRDPSNANKWAVQFFYPHEQHWTTHYNSPLVNDPEHELLTSSWIYNSLHRTYDNGTKVRIGQVKDAYIEPEEHAPTFTWDDVKRELVNLLRTIQKRLT